MPDPRFILRPLQVLLACAGTLAGAASAQAQAQGIRLLNISLAASATESWQTDPLCVAVRSASAAGINAGGIPAGTSMLASGKRMPAASATINGSAFHWSRIVFAGGSQLLSGSALFTKYQIGRAHV